MGHTAIEFNIDSNVPRSKGFSITPDRGKIIAGETYTISVNY